MPDQPVVNEFGDDFQRDVAWWRGRLDEAYELLVEAWHTRPEDGVPLHEFMGLSRQEYALRVGRSGAWRDAAS